MMLMLMLLLMLMLMLVVGEIVAKLEIDLTKM